MKVHLIWGLVGSMLIGVFQSIVESILDIYSDKIAKIVDMDMAHFGAHWGIVIMACLVVYVVVQRGEIVTTDQEIQVAQIAAPFLEEVVKDLIGLFQKHYPDSQPTEDQVKTAAATVHQIAQDAKSTTSQEGTK